MSECERVRGETDQLTQGREQRRNMSMSRSEMFLSAADVM